MSFKVVEPCTPRLNRCELAVPGSSPQMFEKAARSKADVVFLDLEDAVAPDEKPKARRNVVQALNEVDWGRKTLSVRINGLDTHYAYRDIIDVVEQAGKRLDLVMIPKIGTAADVYAVDMLLTQIEAAMGLKKRIGIEVIVETALGLANVEAIAGASRRLESLHFGVADFSASTRARTVNIGGPNPLYVVMADADVAGNRAVSWADPWHYAVARLVVAARANGLRPIDGPYGDFRDGEGYRAAARRSVALGCEGKWAIHPSQIEIANEVFTPPASEIEKARRILAAMDQAGREGKGAVQLDGKLIDLASIRQAQSMVAQAEAIARGG
ncbi:MAG: CoA ester lyase [Alphaproteobacteria bacterium]|nr:CoA ester lyase [Alphaproteobacteria bacterium]